MTFKKFLIVFFSAWILGFGLGQWLGSRYSKQLENRDNAISYMNENARLWLTGRPGISDSIYVPLCDEQYVYSKKLDTVTNSFYGDYKTSKLDFIDASSVSVLTLLTGMGITPMTAKEILKEGKSNWLAYVAGGAGVITGIGTGFWLSADRCKCDRKTFREVAMDTKRWQAVYAVRQQQYYMRGVIVPASALKPLNR